MYRTMRTDRIAPNPDQPRKLFDPEALAELADSIRKHGLLQPIVVRPIPGGPHMIIAGERRWRACVSAGIDMVSVKVLTDLDDEQAYVMSVAENVNRVDMTLIEEAKAFAALVNLGRTPAEIGALFGKTESYVTWRLPFLSLTPTASDLAEKGQLKPLLAYYVAACSPANQSFILTRYLSGSFTTEQEAVAFAQAVKANEDSPVMFGEIESAEETARRGRATSDARARLDRVSALAAHLAQIAAADPADLARALGSTIGTEAARFEDVYKMCLAARKTIRRAHAAAQATEPDRA